MCEDVPHPAPLIYATKRRIGPCFHVVYRVHLLFTSGPGHGMMKAHLSNYLP